MTPVNLSFIKITHVPIQYIVKLSFKSSTNNKTFQLYNLLRVTSIFFKI